LKGFRQTGRNWKGPRERGRVPARKPRYGKRKKGEKGGQEWGSDGTGEKQKKKPGEGTEKESKGKGVTKGERGPYVKKENDTRMIAAGESGIAQEGGNGKTLTRHRPYDRKGVETGRRKVSPKKGKKKKSSRDNFLNKVSCGPGVHSAKTSLRRRRSKKSKGERS